MWRFEWLLSTVSIEMVLSLIAMYHGIVSMLVDSTASRLRLTTDNSNAIKVNELELNGLFVPVVYMIIIFVQFGRIERGSKFDSKLTSLNFLITQVGQNSTDFVIMLFQTFVPLIEILWTFQNLNFILVWSKLEHNDWSPMRTTLKHSDCKS